MNHQKILSAGSRSPEPDNAGERIAHLLKKYSTGNKGFVQWIPIRFMLVLIPVPSVVLTQYLIDFCGDGDEIERLFDREQIIRFVGSWNRS